MNHPQPQGYLATPPSGTGRGVLVLHAWWGLNDTIKSFCTKLADSGLVAFAPDLYHGQVARTIPEAEVLGHALETNPRQAKAEVAAAAQFLSEHAGVAKGGLAVIAFSLGAYYAVHLAATEPELIRAVVLFYGSGEPNVSQSKASFLGHYAENDPYEEPIYRQNLEKSLKAAGRPVTFYDYPGTSLWFVEPDRTEQYNPAAAALAWERTLRFLKDELK